MPRRPPGNVLGNIFVIAVLILADAVPLSD